MLDGIRKERQQQSNELFGLLILDCLERTERAMIQAHAFKAAELCLKAQALADSARLRAS